MSASRSVTQFKHFWQEFISKRSPWVLFWHCQCPHSWSCLVSPCTALHVHGGLWLSAPSCQGLASTCQHSLPSGPCRGCSVPGQQPNPAGVPTESSSWSKLVCFLWRVWCWDEQVKKGNTAVWIWSLLIAFVWFHSGCQVPVPLVHGPKAAPRCCQNCHNNCQGGTVFR